MIDRETPEANKYRFDCQAECENLWRFPSGQTLSWELNKRRRCLEVVSRLDSTQLSALEVLEGCVRTRLEESPAALQLQLLHMSSSRVLTQLAHIVGIPADTRCSLVPSCRKEMPILKLRKDDNNRGSRICKCCAAFTLKCFGEFHQRVMMRGFAPKAEKLDRTGTSNWMWKWSQRRRFTFSLSVEESFSLYSKFVVLCYYREL